MKADGAFDAGFSIEQIQRERQRCITQQGARLFDLAGADSALTCALRLGASLIVQPAFPRSHLSH